MWHDQTFETLRREYVNTGKVRMAYLHFPLKQHPQALPAAEASMCASAQGKFWEYQSALFTEQNRWMPAGNGSAAAAYDSIAAQVGADVPRFRACMQSHVMRAQVEADRDRMASAGAQSTPRFFIGDQVIAGALPIQDFRRVLDAAVAKAGG